MRNLLPTILLFTALLAGPAALHAQEGIGRKQQQRIQAKKAREEKKAKARKAKDDRKRQLEIQDKATRKRLKRNFRAAEKHGGGGHGQGGGFHLFRRKR